MKRVLVFDSGIGGLSVLDAIVASEQAVELSYLADNAWLPYGLKTDEQLEQRVPRLLAHVAEAWKPEAIIVACNTASTIALDEIRAGLAQEVIGVVPPIKPAAALTKTGVIGLLATPATVRRAYTDDLIARFAPGVRVVRYGSTALVAAAEEKLRGGAPPSSAIEEAMSGLFGAEGGGAIDVVALACTHFPLLKTELAAASPAACAWLDSGEAIARRLGAVLGAARGGARLGQTAFTDIAAARLHEAAFAARGFQSMSAVSNFT